MDLFLFAVGSFSPVLLALAAFRFTRNLRPPWLRGCAIAAAILVSFPIGFALVMEGARPDDPRYQNSPGVGVALMLHGIVWLVTLVVSIAGFVVSLLPRTKR